jgi:hypothetical protein
LQVLEVRDKTIEYCVVLSCLCLAHVASPHHLSCCCALQVLEVRDVTIKDCAVRVKQGSSKNQMEEGLTDWECWLEYEVRRER